MSDQRLVALRDDAMDSLKPDWREAKQRLTDWWAGKKIDRAVACMTTTRPGVAPHKARGSLVERYIDSATSLANFDDWLGRVSFWAESFPVHRVNMGPALLGAFLGADLEFRDTTVWQKPLGLTWDQIDQIDFSDSNKWWRVNRDLVRAASEHSRGRYLVYGGDSGAIADVMINLLGHEETLVAMIERPEKVKELRDRMLLWVKRMIDETNALLAPYQDGDIDWIHIWAPGSTATFQCDACVMLSPPMFNDLFLEEIQRECRMVDYPFYHLDGSAEMRHLDALLSIKELRGIQWTPEPAVPPNPDHYSDVWRRVQAAGKKLMFFVRPEHVQPLLNKIDRNGVFMSISCKDEPEALETLRLLERMGT